MSRIKLLVLIIVFGAVVFSYVAILKRPPRRPPNVPVSAVFVAGAKTGWWQDCSARDQGMTVCRVFSQTGLTLVDEEFLPYDGGKSPSAPELVLDPGNRFSDVYRVCLKNGRILLPKSMYTRSKQLLDSLETGKK